MDTPFRIGPALVAEAPAIARIHVEVWRNAYPGLLPDHTLHGLSEPRLAWQYDAAIERGDCVLVARAGTPPLVVGFATASRCGPAGNLADGEVETLYLLDDWRDRGIGRALLEQAARQLAALGCRSLFLWVLADNPSRWFYAHLGGRAGLHGTTSIGGSSVAKVAMIWDDIAVLTGGASPSATPLPSGRRIG